VIDCAARRKVLQAGIRIAQAAARGAGDLPDLMHLVAAELHAVADEVTAHEQVRVSRRQPIPLSAAIEETLPQLTSVRQNAIDDIRT
jgi:hypothetical protein